MYKQGRQLQIHFLQELCPILDLEFIGNSYLFLIPLILCGLSAILFQAPIQCIGA